jgi:hypothetical protein
MTVKRGNEFLHTPGPTNIPGRILNAMHRPSVDFVSPEFSAVSDACFAGLKPIFQTEGEIFIYAGLGHGAWEAALANTLSPGDRILVPETGNFSLSWSRMAEALGVLVDHMPNDWRHAVDAAEVEARLRDGFGKIPGKPTRRCWRCTPTRPPASPATWPPSAPPSMPRVIPRSSWSTPWPRSRPAISAWTNGASTCPSAPARRG